MTKKSIPQFKVGEKAFSRYGDPVTIMSWPVYYGRPGDPLPRGGRYMHPGPAPAGNGADGTKGHLLLAAGMVHQTGRTDAHATGGRGMNATLSNLTIKTATVEIKVIQVDGHKMTKATFNQIMNASADDFINIDGVLSCYEVWREHRTQDNSFNCPDAVIGWVKRSENETGPDCWVLFVDDWGRLFKARMDDKTTHLPESKLHFPESYGEAVIPFSFIENISSQLFVAT